MSNDSKNIKKEQKTNSVTSFYQEIRNSEYDELIALQKSYRGRLTLRTKWHTSRDIFVAH